MKKILIIYSFLIGLFCSCTQCTTKQEVIANIQDVENTISTDYNAMYSMHGQDYFRWYECDILLDEFLDEECDGSIAELVNIFQTTVVFDSLSFDTKVYKIQHFSDGKVVKDSVSGFWIENHPMFPDSIKITYKQAFELMQSVNYPKPHSQHVTIRKPIGPLDCNIQYIFGNIHSQIWVDAVTGEIRQSNPAFPAELKIPLGEWP